MPLVYDHLRGMAANHLRREREDHTLQTSGLVNEAFLRLVAQNQVDWESRSHFFAIAARVMRRILLDHARHHGRARRDSKETMRFSPEAFDQIPTERPEHLIALDDALNALAKKDPMEADLVEMRYFGGMTKEEVAAVLGVSTATVTRRWRTARGWLYNFLVRGDDGLI